MPPTASRSARELCAQVQQNKDALKGRTNFVNAVNPFSAITNLVSNLTSKNEAESLVINNVENKLDASTRQSLRSECTNQTTIKNTNTIDTTECIKALGCDKLMANADRMSSDQLDRVTKMCSFTNIHQSNQNRIQSNCTTDLAIKALKNAELDANLMAALEKLQESKGLMAQNSSSTLSCNDIRQDVDASTYINAYQNCMNQFQAENANFSTCASNVDQSNFNDIFHSCMQQQNIYNETTAKASTMSKLVDTVKQKAEGLNLNCSASLTSLLVVVLIVAALFLIPLLLKNMRKRRPGMGTAASLATRGAKIPRRR